MTRRSDRQAGPDDDRDAIQLVETELEELGDPETSPPLPSATLAAHAAVAAHQTPTLGATNVAEILRLAWPVMLSQVLVSIAGLVDRAMVGRLGGDEGAAIPLAAVGYATQFFFLIQSALFAVGLACVALMARAIGAGSPERARQALAASMQVSLVVTLVFTAIILIGARWMLAGLGAEPAVVEAAIPYLNLIIGSSVVLAISMIFDSGLRANRDTRTPMWIAVAVTAVKLVGNWALIFGNGGFPRLELAGAGIATVFSQLVGLGLFAVAMARQAPESPARFSIRGLWVGGPQRAEVVRIALPGIAERVVMNIALLSYFWILSRYYGTISVAAYTVGVPLLSFSWIPGVGYAQACATLVGQSLGAGAAPEAERIGWRSARLALGTALVTGLVFGTAREPLARLFTSDLDVIAALGPFMLVLSIAQPFLQLHFTLGGAHRGAGDTWTPLIAATIGNWVFRVPLALIFAIVLQADIIWVWATLLVDHVGRAVYLTWSFRGGRWKTRLDR